MTGLIQKDYEDTIMMLNACNAPALAMDLANIIPRIWEEAHALNKGTSWVATHPIMLLWIAKISDIQHSTIAPYERWEKAYNYCKSKMGLATIGDAWDPDKEYGDKGLSPRD